MEREENAGVDAARTQRRYTGTFVVEMNDCAEPPCSGEGSYFREQREVSGVRAERG